MAIEPPAQRQLRIPSELAKEGIFVFLKMGPEHLVSPSFGDLQEELESVRGERWSNKWGSLKMTEP